MVFQFTIFRKKTWLALCLFFVYSFISPRASAQSSVVDSLVARLEIIPNDTNKAILLNKITLQYLYSDLDKAKEYALRSLAFSRKIKFKKSEASAHGYLAEYYGLLSDHESAKKHWQEAEKIFKEINNVIGLAAVNNYYGSYYARKGEHDKAIKKYMIALKTYEKIGEKRGKSISLNSIAGIFAQLRQFKSAKKYYAQSLVIKKELNDVRGLSLVYMNLGVMEYELFEFDTALLYFDSCLTIQKQLNDDRIIAICKTNISNIYIYRKQHALAFTTLKESFHHYTNQRDTLNMAVSLRQMALTSRLSGNLTKAQEYIDLAMKLVQKIDDERVLRGFYLEFMNISRARRDYEKMMMAFDRINDIDSVLYSHELLNKVYETREKYEIGKRAGEIRLLKEKEKSANALAQKRKAWLVAGAGLLFALGAVLFLYFRQRKIREKQRQTELEQKALRAQMNPHFIFNSLNSIQRMYVEGKLDMANEHMADFAELMRRILDNSNKSLITLKEELDTLKLYLDLEKIRCQGMMNYEIKWEDLISTSTLKVPPLVIQPFVENAIWHGILPKKSPGLVRISVHIDHENDTHVICIVEDDGMGWSPGNGVSPGNGKRHEPMGISITEQRLGSRIQVEKRAEGGTRITILIPVVI